MTGLRLATLLGVILLAGCARATADVPAPTSESTAPSVSSVESSGPTVQPSVSPVRPKASPSTAPESTAFAGTIRAVGAAELGPTWRPSCPVPVEDLRWLDLRFRNAAGELRQGALIVHRDHAEAVVSVFAALFEARFPIEQMRPISEFDGDDDASMAANNTSAFNCREISGRPGVWSQHAFGAAIDVNPLVNPWVRGAQVDPPAGAAHADRTVPVPGLITPGDVVTTAFAGIGWQWGGDWTGTVDYQHFSANGR